MRTGLILSDVRHFIDCNTHRILDVIPRSEDLPEGDGYVVLRYNQYTDVIRYPALLRRIDVEYDTSFILHTVRYIILNPLDLILLCRGGVF